MIRNWNIDKIKADLQQIQFTCTDPGMDGFVTWGCKQDLYRVKFYLDELLKSCPTYSVEQEWLDQIEKDKVWNTLNQRK